MVESKKVNPKKERFIALYGQLGQIKAAAAGAGIAQNTHYEWLKKDPEYAAAFAAAKQVAADSLESEAVRRAMAGSDTLLIFLLKGALPDKYKERVASTVSNPDGSALLAGLKVTYVSGQEESGKDSRG